ncbi:MAG: hypothetical protein HZT40_22460 [Candidatus Thiothrix singaporensis]|uniref:Uncharacterized protein n=1 Tax=Candidatus Thiothrix singaporensis TaxID=2799669 RepID=A0A7L6AXZ3_9GAMM|nr:MAG: hypothetical protein HZT40_22460 [Candidatus Thiothrix singaporensis]
MADKWCSLCGKHTDHRSGYHARQPCRTCRHYTEGQPCPVGGEVQAWWTGCIVWDAVDRQPAASHTHDSPAHSPAHSSHRADTQAGSGSDCSATGNLTKPTSTALSPAYP